MTIKTAIKSIKKKGIKKYVRDFINNRQKKFHRQRLEKELRRYFALAKGLNDNTVRSHEEVLLLCHKVTQFTTANESLLKPEEILELCMPVAGVISADYKELKKQQPALLIRVESQLWILENNKNYKRHMKRHYIKDLYPEVYIKKSKKPVEDKVIMMEAGFSPSPSSRHLAEVIIAQGKYRVVYISLMVRAVPMIVFYENGMHMIEELATAKAMFLSTTNDLLSHFDVRKETKIIQLWHGVGAFKHVGYSTIDNEFFGKNQKQWNEFDAYRNYTALTTAAKGQQWIFEDSTRLSPDKILPIGIARTDIFFDTEYAKNASEKLHRLFPQIGDRKIILYAPTFRGVVADAQAPDKLDVSKMAEALTDEYVLLIKHHGLSKKIPPIPENLENSFAYDLNKNNELNIDELLVVADICITDYSSIAFEYAIREKPIIFFAYDLEDYVEKRGLYFDFEKDAPGPVCRDTESIVAYILDIESAFDKEKLLSFKKEYVDACDGHATERTIALIES